MIISFTRLTYIIIPGIFNGPFQDKGHCGRAVCIFGSLSRFGCVSGIVLASQVNLKIETKQDKYNFYYPIMYMDLNYMYYSKGGLYNQGVVTP